MNKTLSFVALDFRLIKPYVKSLLLLGAMGIVMGAGFQSATTLSSFFMFSLMLVMSYPFTISEKNGLDTLYGTLSLSRRTVVRGRYLFVLCLEVICAVLAILSSAVLARVLGIEFSMQEATTSMGLLSGIFLLVVAMQYPIYFKFGYTKARFIALAPMFVVFFAVIQFPTLAKLFHWEFSWDTVMGAVAGSPILIYLVPVGVGLVAFYISYLVSCRIYARRDF